MSIRYDPDANAAYVSVGREPSPGESVQQVSGIRDPRGHGEVILDFDAEGRLIGVEILGARELLRSAALAGAERTPPVESL